MCVVWVLVLGLGGREVAQARDVRVALLVGHQHGWNDDPVLRYALQGDLHPFARALRRIGFRVHLLQNPTPHQVRHTFQQLHRQFQTQPASTFLFYYSGHADRSHFHLGKKRKHPLSYKEFVSFLQKLPVKRRIAFVDACFSGEIIRQFGSLRAYRKLVPKGIRSIRPIDLSKNFPNQGSFQGIQVVTSSLEMAWESKEYRASIFTHYLLQGIRGPADQNNDGKISVYELFNFVSRAMKREVKQTPLLFGVIKRSGAYALAPAYHSRLWIGPKVLGKIRVSVDNFYWSRNKAQRRPIRLAVISGKGTVELERNGSCWKQRIHIPKGREARILPRWTKVVCQRSERSQKGSIQLPAQLYRKTQAPRTKEGWALEAQGGWLHTRLAGGNGLAGGSVGVRHSYVGVSLGVWGNSVAFQESKRQQLFLELLLQGGWRHRWGRWDLFAGGFLGGGVLLQDLNIQPQMGAVLRAGARVIPSVWLSSRWALFLDMSGGMALGQFGGEFRPLLLLQASLGLRFRL